MEWKIDTGMVGEVSVKDLKATLEANRDHFLRTQADGAGRAVMLAVHDPKLPGAPEVDFAAVAEAAKAAKDAHLAKQEDLKAQIAVGIEAACKIASVIGGKVSVTVSGHHNPRHSSACAQRMVVSVDQTWDE